MASAITRSGASSHGHPQNLGQLVDTPLQVLLAQFDFLLQ
jgi:hypothetical protein